MSDLEKLANVIQQLNNISVPTILLEQVTVPIRNAAIVLDGVYKNMKKNEQDIQQSSEIISDGDFEFTTTPPAEELNG